MSEAFAELSGWVAPTYAQAALREQFLAHIADHDRPASRSCLPDHLTASALVVSDTGTHVLLALHRKVGLWLQFGGHVEPGDRTLSSAALREAREESGLDAVELASTDPIQLDRHPAPCSSAAGQHLDVQFLAVTSRTEQPRASTESLDVRWFEATRLPTPTDEAVHRLVSTATDRYRQLAAGQSTRPAD